MLHDLPRVEACGTFPRADRWLYWLVMRVGQGARALRVWYPPLSHPSSVRDGVLRWHVTPACAGPPGAHRVTMPGAVTAPGVPAGDVSWGAAVDPGICPCRMVRTRPAAPRASS